MCMRHCKRRNTTEFHEHSNYYGHSHQLHTLLERNMVKDTICMLNYMHEFQSRQKHACRSTLVLLNTMSNGRYVLARKQLRADL